MDWYKGPTLIEALDAAVPPVRPVEKPLRMPIQAVYKIKGVGTVAAPRGGLGHWIKIKDGKIENYQCVVPTTWNGSPRDAKGNIGAFEACLINTPVERPNEPVEILRSLHSFDPCLACSTHVMGPDGQELTTVKVR